MPAPRPRRRALLFLGAVILPSVVLLGTTLRLILQERELRERRQAEQRTVLAAQIGHQLHARLERLRLIAASVAPRDSAGAGAGAAADAALVIAAPIVDGRPLLPWEASAPRPATAAGAAPDSPFRRLIRQAEAAEFVESRHGEAARLYARAERAAGGPVERAEAALMRARALARAGNTAAADSLLLALADLPAALVDAEAMPYALYAADRLGDAHPRAALQALERVAAAAPIQPAAAYALRDLAARLAAAAEDARSRAAADSLHGRVLRRLADIETLTSLKRDLPGLLALSASRGRDENGASVDEPVQWFAYGDEPWLVGAHDGALTVARPAPLLAQIAAAGRPLGAGAQGARLVTAGEAAEPDAEPLGAAFPGLRLRLPADAVTTADGSPLGGTFLLLALPFILGVTVFTAYLVWRDVRREMAAAELRSQFVASVSHELKTPLTAIRMFAEMLRMRSDQDPHARAEYLDTIVNESERLSRLINNVLDFSRIERGERAYKRAPTPLEDVVRDAARAMTYPLEQQGFHLTIEAERDLPPVPVDRDAVLQAVLNLLSNAIKFSGPNCTIDLRLARRNGDVLIQVTDRGRGIEPVEHQAIFDRFYRSPAAVREGIPGTGLGLALAAHVARGHGGRVEVRSTPGQGSTFTLRLPLDEASR